MISEDCMVKYIWPKIIDDDFLHIVIDPCKEFQFLYRSNLAQ